ncbi:3D domain-containing protein [Caldanaerobius polysaccharolyticus]|uniref:3D domain-containing protein n=1 Tax=Caldanaerobius polysaccharolyticus TaxID=44256 RepID=UPI00068CFCAB|nr:3D domain-containing protein [Caldanaerobius polysaccharolyticus]
MVVKKRWYLFVTAIAIALVWMPFLFRARVRENSGWKKLLFKNAVVYNIPRNQLARINQRLFGNPDLQLKWVNIQIGNKKIKTSTDKKFVADIIKQAGIKIGNKDEVKPSLWEIVKSGETIRIYRVDERIVTEVKDVPFDVKKSYTTRLEVGKSKVIQEGQQGKKQLKYKVILKDGKEIARTLLEEKVIKAPISKVIAVGTIGMITTSRGETIRYSRVMTMEATAYSCSYSDTGKSPGDRGYGITALGIKARPGVAAVDPSVIPLGTRLYVEGYGYALAADTGSAIVGNKIDLYFTEPEKAQRYGRRLVKVYILK